MRSQLTKAPWRCPICLWRKSRVRNNRQHAAACVWRFLDHNLLRKKKLELVPIATCWPCPATGWPFCRFLFAAGPPSVPTLAPQCRLERLHARSCQIALAASGGIATLNIQVVGDVMCTSVTVDFCHCGSSRGNTDHHPRRVDHRQLADLQSKRPKASSPGQPMCQ